MLEACSDKNWPCTRWVSLREHTLFEAMKDALQVEDPPRTADNLQFSWDNQ
jgi:hypothetical protein